MDAKVVGKDLVELHLDSFNFHLSEKKIRDLMKLLEHKLFELKDFECVIVLAEKQRTFKFG